MLGLDAISEMMPVMPSFWNWYNWRPQTIRLLCEANRADWRLGQSPSTALLGHIKDSQLALGQVFSCHPVSCPAFQAMSLCYKLGASASSCFVGYPLVFVEWTLKGGWGISGRKDNVTCLKISSSIQIGTRLRNTRRCWLFKRTD